MKKKLSLIMLVIAMVCLTCVICFACKGPSYVIGVQQATAGQYWVEGSSDWGFEGYSNVGCKKYNNGGLAVNDMKNGNVNAVVIDKLVAEGLVKDIQGLKVIDITLTVEEYAFGVDKAQPQLLSSINSIMETAEFAQFKEELFAKYTAADFNKDSVVGIEALTTADASKAAQQLVVATNAEFAPFEYKVGNKFAGIDMEIAKYVADALNLELVILDMEFDAVVISVGKNNIDIAMSGLTVTPARKETVSFTNSYYSENAQVLVVLESDKTFDECKTVEDINKILSSK